MVDDNHQHREMFCLDETIWTSNILHKQVCCVSDLGDLPGSCHPEYAHVLYDRDHTVWSPVHWMGAQQWVDGVPHHQDDAGQNHPHLCYLHLQWTICVCNTSIQEVQSCGKPNRTCQEVTPASTDATHYHGCIHIHCHTGLSHPGAISGHSPL